MVSRIAVRVAAFLGVSCAVFGGLLWRRYRCYGHGRGAREHQSNGDGCGDGGREHQFRGRCGRVLSHLVSSDEWRGSGNSRSNQLTDLHLEQLVPEIAHPRSFCRLTWRPMVRRNGGWRTAAGQRILYAAATNDQDGDLVPTWLEYWANTRPNDSNNYLGLEAIGPSVDGTTTLSWICSSNVFYGIGFATDLVSGAFVTVTQNLSASFGQQTMSADIAAVASNAAYRVQAQTAGLTQYVGWAVGSRTNGYGYILHTRDGGYTWDRQGYPGDIADVSLGGVAAVDDHTAWVVGGADSGYSSVYRTTNSGATWIRLGGTGMLPTQSLLKVSALDSNTIWAVGDNGTVVSTTNGGVSWTHQTVPGYADTSFQGVYVVDREWVWVTGGSNDPCATILLTTNAGASWERQISDVVTNIDHILGVSAVSRDVAAAVGGFGYWILITTNGGQTWEGQQHGAQKDGNEVCMVSSSEVWAACDSTIFWTTNGGNDWAEHTAIDYTVGIDVVGTQAVWAVRQGLEGTIFHTPDGGDHWVEQSIPNTPFPGLSTVSFAK